MDLLTATRNRLAAVAVLIVILSSCGPPPRPPEPDNLYWPLPPDPPRIKYLRSIYAEDDIGRKYSLLEKLFGKDYHDALLRPYGVFGGQDRIAIADIGLRRVFLFDLAVRRLTIIGDDNTLQYPSGVVIDREGTIYVADGAAGKVAIYEPSGRYRTAFLLKDGKPVALALDEARNRLYVVDAVKNRVVAFKLDGSRLHEFGRGGTLPGEFNLPIDITVDRRGDVYVLDARNFRIQIFSDTGVYRSSFGAVGDGPGFLANPKGVAVDSHGNIYVTDAAFSNFQIFDREGRLLLFVGRLGMMPGELHLPGGISIDEQDRIYVADQLNSRIQVFQYLAGQ